MKSLGNLEKITKDKLNKLYKEKIPVNILKRYNSEMKFIKEKKLENNYLLAYKIIEKAKQDNRIVIDRVCGSSYIDYLLGMTFVNPIKYELSNDIRKVVTFDFGVASDYFQVIYDYMKKVFKKYELSDKFDISELKKYGIYLQKSSYAYKLEELEKETKLGRFEINLNDIKVYKDLNNNEVFLLEEYNSKKQIFNILNLNSINELANVYSLTHSTLDIDYNEFYNYDLKIFPYTRDHIYEYFLKHHIKRKDAIVITHFIYRGRIKRDNKTWCMYKKCLIEHNVDCQYIEILERIGYLWPKSICINRAIIIYWLSCYRLYYPKEYYKVMLSSIGCQYIYEKTYNYSINDIKQRYYELNQKKKLHLDIEEYEELEDELNLLKLLIEMDERNIKYSIMDKRVVTQDDNVGEMNNE